MATEEKDAPGFAEVIKRGIDAAFDILAGVSYIKKEVFDRENHLSEIEREIGEREAGIRKRVSGRSKPD